MYADSTKPKGGDGIGFRHRLWVWLSLRTLCVAGSFYLVLLYALSFMSSSFPSLTVIFATFPRKTSLLTPN